MKNLHRNVAIFCMKGTYHTNNIIVVLIPKKKNSIESKIGKKYILN